MSKAVSRGVRGFDPPLPRNVCLTHKNVTKMDINKFCVRFVIFILYKTGPQFFLQ